MILDVATNFLTCYASARRDADAAYKAIIAAYGRRKVRYARFDNAPELIAACEEHRIPFETSAPYIHQTNGLIESHNRIELYGGKASFEQCGAPLCFWPLALAHFAFSRNLYPVGNSQESAYEKRFGEGPFNGIRAPFFARVRFRPLPPDEDNKYVHRVQPNMVYGVFVGWVLAPGGKFTGRYKCTDLSEFINMDLRVGGHIRIQEVFEV